jgi:elongation factor Tu
MNLKKCTLVALIILAAFSATLAQKPTPVPTPEHFRMEVEDVFPIAGAGIVARGTIAEGKVKVGDEVDVVGLNPTKTTTVVGIIKPPVRERQTDANKGDAVGIILKGVTKDDLARGQVIAKTGTIRSHTKFKATVDVNSTLASGKRTPITNGYRPMVYIGLGMYSGIVTLDAGTTEIQPGTKGVVVTIELEKPAALVIGQEVSFREGSRVTAKGVVTGSIDKK